MFEHFYGGVLLDAVLTVCVCAARVSLNSINVGSKF